MYKRTTNIAEKIKDARLKIDEWKVLFAVDNNSNPQKIADFLEISLEKVNEALAHLEQEGFVSTGEDPDVAEEKADTDVAPMKMDPEQQAEELVEEIFEEEPAAEEASIEAIAVEEESDAGEVVEEIAEEPEEEAVIEELSEDEQEETILEDTIEDVAEEEPVVEEEVVLEEELEVEEEIIPEEEPVVDEVTTEEELSLDEEIPTEEETVAEEELILDEIAEEKVEAVSEEVVEEAPSDDESKKSSGDGKKVMIVDDSIVIRKMVEIALENENFTIESAVSGKEALKKVDAIEPDLVILDIMLPDVSGIEILKAIKASKGIPVIMLSGKNSPQDIELAKAQGADDFAPKPFKEEELVEKIKALL